jgi:hypothetical protein
MFNSAGSAIDTISGHCQDVVDPTRFISDTLPFHTSGVHDGQTSRLALGSDHWCLQRSPARRSLGAITKETVATRVQFDGMTGLFNRRHFLWMAEIEWSRYQRYQRPMSVLMVDIDQFKSVNDSFGHHVGDHVSDGSYLPGAETQIGCRRAFRRRRVPDFVARNKLSPRPAHRRATLAAGRGRRLFHQCALFQRDGQYWRCRG